MADQAANSGGGQAAGKAFVQFSRPAAQRIAKVVRTVEAGNRSQGGVVFDHPMPGGNGVSFRSATFTGSWDISSTTPKVVTFKYISGGTATANAYNDLMSLPDSGTRACVVGKEGTAWRLINWQWNIAYAATAATLTTTSLEFTTLPVGAVATSSTSTFSVSVVTCSTSTAS